MSTREELIAKIILQRQPFVQRIEQVENVLKARQKALQQLELLRVAMIPKLDNSIAINLFKSLDLRKLKERVATEMQALQKLKRRFKRPTLNIGVVGRARQGKSHFLQRVTGLTSNEIPSGNRGHCTGVSSTIYHRPDDRDDRDYDFDALVWFHTEKSFLEEIIKPYYEQLELGNVPQDIQSFDRNILPELPENLNQYAEHRAKYGHLKKYKDSLAYNDSEGNSYAKLLGTTSDAPLRIKRDQIREYVAQDDQDGNRVYFKYLAVKHVKIYCSFPQKDVGKIALIDSIGLGDTGIGDELRLVKTLGEDVDLVVFIKKPKSTGDVWEDVDIKLYDTAKTALIELPVRSWSYMILNREITKVDNYLNCQDLQNSIKQHHIDVIQSPIVDCDNKDEVAEFLDMALNYLSNSINDLDRKYAQSCQIRLQELEKDVNEELSRVRNLLSDYVNTSRQFSSLFKQFMVQLSTSMAHLARELHDKMEQVSPEFDKQVKKALEDCKSHRDIPSTDMILERYPTPDGKGSYKIVYQKYMIELRASISQHFHRLNDGLKDSVFNLKNQVSNTLCNEAGLGYLTSERNANFLLVMANKFAEKDNKLELGFRTFYEYEMSYGALLLKDVRQHLDQFLSPDISDIELTNLNSTIAQKNLKLLYDRAITECEKTLDVWLSTPSIVQFYMVEEFLDRILYANGMEDEWRAFLDDAEIRVLVWTEFRQIEERKRLQENWRQQVDLVKIIPNSLTFL